MKNAVLLAPYFLPRRRVGSWRPFKFAIHLREFGWQPHIITLASPSGALTEKEARLLEGIDIHEISPPFDFTQSSGSQLSKTNGSSKSADSFLQPVLNWFDKQFPVDTWLPLFMLQRRKIARILRQIDPDVLWSTGDPWSSHWLGGKLARQLELPWVADFRDPWTLGEMNLKERSSFSSAVDRRVERNVIQAAERLIFTSKTTRKLYAGHYKDAAAKMEVIYNTFDGLLYDEPDESQQLFDSQTLNLLFFGAFRRLSPARPFINLLVRLADRNKEHAIGIKMYSFGPLDESDSAYARQKGVLDQFVTLEPIPPEKMLSVLPQADLLWLSTAPQRRTIIPAKLWDYLAAGRPIISIAPNPEIGTVLDETGAGLQFQPDRYDALIDLLYRCAEAKQEDRALPVPFERDKANLTRFEAKGATRTLARTFEELI